MKKYLLTFVLLLLSTAYTFAQQESNKITIDSAKIVDINNGSNEIKINLLYSILGMPEITYERIFNNNSGLGLSVFKAIEKDIDYQLGFTPYYRVYFGNNKKSSGFFIEVNAVAMQLNEKNFSYDDINGTGSYHYGKKWNFGFGAAAGGKFLTKNGLIGELTFGAGRFIDEPKTAMEVYPRGGIMIGKRF